MTNIMYIYFIMACCFLRDSLSLELTKIVIPMYKIHGETAALECHYELKNGHESRHGRDHGFGGSRSPSNDNNGIDHHTHSGAETLYSVKWYKDNEEFYRFIPKANPPQQSYKVDGVRVDVALSDTKRVTLKRVTLKSSGLYRCEVSAEAPNFSSVEGEGRMEVVFLPRDGPHISGEEKQYQIGDTLNINCTSGKSHPSSLIEWLINEEPVTKSSLIHYDDLTNSHGLLTSTLGLQVILDGSHFKNGSMRVKCITSVSPLLWLNVNGKYPQKRPPLVDNREAMLLVRSSAQKLFVTFELSQIIAFSLIMSFLLFKPFLS